MNDLELLAIHLHFFNLKLSLARALVGFAILSEQAEQPTTLNAACNASSDIAQDTAEKVEALV